MDLGKVWPPLHKAVQYNNGRPNNPTTPPDHASPEEDPATNGGGEGTTPSQEGTVPTVGDPWMGADAEGTKVAGKEWDHTGMEIEG